MDGMRPPTNLGTAPWAGPFIRPPGAQSSPLSVLSSPHKQKLQPPVTKFRKKLKRGKTSSASFSVEDITATVTFLYGLVTQSSSFESSGEPVLTYGSYISQPRAFVGPVRGITHHAALLDMPAAVTRQGLGITPVESCWGSMKDSDLTHQGGRQFPWQQRRGCPASG